MLNTLHSDRNPLLSLVLIVSLAFIASAILPLIFIAVFSFLLNVEYTHIIGAFDSPKSYPDLKWPLLSIQFLVSFSAFVVIPLLFLKRHEGVRFSHFFQLNKVDSRTVITTGFLALAFMVVNSVFIEWNMNVQFPEALDQTAREWEDRGKELTEYFTDFDSIPYFIFCIVAIAVVPAVGEELLFRGLIQSYIVRISGNKHVAIWLAAIFFSAFHFQFFGFVPRMLLGALFGYLYVYSGNIVYPMFAHFVNNGFTLLMLYLYQNGQITYDVENTASVPLESVAIFTIIGVGLFIFFLKQVKTELPVSNE